MLGMLLGAPSPSCCAQLVPRRRKSPTEEGAGAGLRTLLQKEGKLFLQLWKRGLRNVPGEVGWGSEHPGMVEGVPAHGRGWHWMSFKVPPKPNYPVSL